MAITLFHECSIYAAKLSQLFTNLNITYYYITTYIEIHNEKIQFMSEYFNRWSYTASSARPRPLGSAKSTNFILLHSNPEYS